MRRGGGVWERVPGPPGLPERGVVCRSRGSRLASVEESGQVLGWSEGRGLGEEQWAELGSRPCCHFLIGVPVVPATHLHPPLLSPRPGAQPRVAGRGGL